MVQTNAADIEHSAATHTEASLKCQKVYISFPMILLKTECVHIMFSVNHRTPLTQYNGSENSLLKRTDTITCTRRSHREHVVC